MPYDNPDDAYGLLPSMSFEGTTLAGNRAFEWDYSGTANERKPRIVTVANAYSGITTSDGNAGVPAVPGMLIQISTTIPFGGQITRNTIYNFETTNGRVDAATGASGICVKALNLLLHSGTGGPEIYLLWYEIWRSR